MTAIARLLSDGADPRLAPEALVCCLIADNPEATKLLLQHRAPVNFKADEVATYIPHGHTPLYYAVMFDNGRTLETARLLIKAGADPRLEPGMLGFVIDHNRGTTSDVETLPTLKKLLDLGFPIDGKDDRSASLWGAERGGKRTALWVAVRGGSRGDLDKNIAKLLLERGANPKLAPDVLAMFAGDAAMVRWLLDHGAPVNGAVGSATPLNAALHAGNNESVMILLNAGGDPKLGAPLIMACDDQYEIRFSVVSALLARGADPNVRGIMRRTPLHYAAHTSKLNVIKLLLKNGANPNLRDEEGNTPLHFAAARGLFIVKPLVVAGARINVMNRNRETPRDIAASRRDDQAVRFFDYAATVSHRGLMRAMRTTVDGARAPAFIDRRNPRRIVRR